VTGVEPLLEYQDYLLAYRLRALIGGKLRPSSRELRVHEYARLRLERQELAREVLGRDDYRERLRQVDALTDRLNFGFWHNPNETVIVLRRVIEAGGCSALESDEAFAEQLLTRAERERLGPAGVATVTTYYLGLLRSSASYLDPATFTRLRADVEPLRAAIPVFVALGEDPAPA